MKKLSIYLFLLFNISIKAQTVADDIVGNWISIEKNVIVSCYKIDQKYFGKVLWYKAFDQKTESRAIAKDENTKYLNKLVMRDFQYMSNEWSEGKIIDLTTCKTYNSFIKINEKKQLKVTGYILFRWLSQSLIFEKINEQQKNKYMKISNP